MRGRVVTVALVALLVLCVSGAVRSMEFEHRWVYVSKNLYVDDNVDAVIALMSRAKKTGYTGMVLSDSKFGRLPQMDQRYFDNVARVVEAVTTGVSGVVGIMYTTWENNYDDLESFLKEVRQYRP